jgi:hypothetical protein
MTSATVTAATISLRAFMFIPPQFHVRAVGGYIAWTLTEVYGSLGVFSIGLTNHVGHSHERGAREIQGF